MAPRIEQDIHIDAPVDVVWRVVTEPDQVSKWFADQVDLDPKPGYDGALTFRYPEAAQPLTVQVTVQSVQPQRQFSYRWQHPRGAAAGDGNSLLVEFTLTAEGEGTRLRVVETGLEQMGWSDEQQDTYVREHNFGWVTYLGRLRDYLGRQHADQMP
jgi:uncharacterized protein YndB with AHSA1/START domain